MNCERLIKMYAVIKTGGKQYKVSEGAVIEVESLDVEEGGKVTFDEVLFVGGDKSVTGTPFIDKASVEGEALENGRGAKIIVFHKLRRKGFHKKQGHRQGFTRVRIEKIKM